MDFSLSAEQRELTEAAAAFARRELNHDLAKREDAGEFPREALAGDPEAAWTEAERLSQDL